MTLLITQGGLLATAASLWLGSTSLVGRAGVAYATTYAALLFAALVTGFWWFVRGVGEQRISDVPSEAGLEREEGAPLS